MTTQEQERIAALHEYRLLDLPAGDELEAVVRVAAMVAGVPNATLNLIDENRQCQLTSFGFEGGISARADSMCAVHFEKGDLVVRADAADPIFRINPWVTGELGDSQATTWIASAKRAVGRMSGLITSLLSYAQAGNAPCRFEAVRLGEVVDLALCDLNPRIDGAEITVDDLPELDCDPTLIRQLLQNLIGNSLRYRHLDRTCRIRIGARSYGAAWVVSIADNGRGIPADQRDRVFEMFAQVDPAARTGHGVGLSTCQRIVGRHGGRITATETPGGGTTVTFTLPAMAPVAAARR
ncbi:ATP-binding protein [Actinoplanes sp. NPDC026619]|uniref:sensor histidine kinase n=1 Tax=Actinoplanes sp. NPDC026619 TaxID=3155798 RepID=UPI003403A41B